MTPSNQSPIIVGGGVAGLIAAQHLEAAGRSPILLEGSDRVGGRLKTDLHEGFKLDRGFQVLLTGYKEVNRYLDLDALGTRSFRPGAHIHLRTNHFRIVDPMREPAQIIRSTLSPVGVLKDKMLLARLNMRLRRYSQQRCFKGYESMPTIDYLHKFGFSEQIIERFFRPFFGGIFLEQELQTPAAMFRFIYKMFGQAGAALPAEGIEGVAQHLKAKLKQTDIRCGVRVKAVESGRVLLDDGSDLLTDGGIILACAAAPLVQGLKVSDAPPWKATTNLYFYSQRRLRENRLINLVADNTSTINTFCVLDEVQPHYKPEGKGGSLISVTLKGYRPDDDSAIAQAEQDLLRHSRLPNDALRFLKAYHVRLALPNLDAVSYTQLPTSTRLQDDIFLGGDQELNGSLDAAMRSGRLAALGLLGAHADE
ncbi:MAG: NAD(P)/FAD-dependent oxidoreductase [Bacteroidota bacterium]